jgi:hypothetical protein
MWTSESRLKGVWYEIFAFRFFSESISPGPLSTPWGPFTFFSRKFVKIFKRKGIDENPEQASSSVSTIPAINGKKI